MDNPIVFSLEVEPNSCPNSFVQKQPCSSSMSELVNSINFEDATEQKCRTVPRSLEILFKKVGESKKPLSWMVLRGKERRKNIKRIMQTLKCEGMINPFSVEQFQSFMNALQEHGLEEVSITSADNIGDFLDFQQVVFDFGGDYGNSEFDDFEREYIFNMNRGFDHSIYVANEFMELSSVEEMLNGFLEEKLL
ncbi:hypothetical protein LIER_08811 [Lithospermum erythrorhizon]|uniref:Uncharacterized protein n=1 Tax=Lithospermum erythrorhizon TaxID=34254 RepID=A0AAV3PF20_LITER